MSRECVLYDRECSNCLECEVCDLNNSKKCDNCGICIDEMGTHRSVNIEKFVKEQQNHKGNKN